MKWFLKSYLWLIPLIIIFDYVTKIIAFDKKVNLTIINNFFYFRLYGNTGAAWSILEEHPEIIDEIRTSTLEAVEAKKK